MKILALALTSIALTGCIDAPNRSHARPASATSINNGNSVKLYVIDNGLECAVYNGYQEGGISCNWEKYNEKLLAEARGEL